MGNCSSQELEIEEVSETGEETSTVGSGKGEEEEKDKEGLISDVLKECSTSPVIPPSFSTSEEREGAV
jgi:hypothetical protein